VVSTPARVVELVDTQDLKSCSPKKRVRVRFPPRAQAPDSGAFFIKLRSMSHGKLRTQNDCLNCGAAVSSKYCPECGQLNREPRFNMKDLISDFVHDFTHFDSKFFRTTLFLITKPGFLTKEFIEGKRLKYLNPIRMYVFTSAIFFFFLYLVYNLTEKENNPALPTVAVADGFKDGLSKASSGTDTIKSKSDTIDISSESGFKTIQEYEESQAKLPADKKDNWLEKWSTKQEIRLVDKFKNDSAGTIAGVQKEFVKSLPSLMFISLPFLAFLLQLIYIRRKSISYVDHLLFLLHFYIFSFIISFFFVLALMLTSYDWLGWMGWVATAIMVWVNLYPLLAMRNFYNHSWGGVILRYFVFIIGAFLIFFFLFIIYLIISLLRV
jgi:hypothetical protein